MQAPRKKFDLWPLIVGTIAAIGIIGSNSTGGITKTTREPTAAASSASTAAASSSTTAAGAAGSSAAATTPAMTAPQPSGPAGPSSGDGGQPIRIVDQTAAVRAGDLASVSIIGQPGLTYDILVTFGRTSGGVGGMEAKQADADGRVAWQWRVPVLSPRGAYTITITGGGQSLTSDFTVN